MQIIRMSRGALEDWLRLREKGDQMNPHHEPVVEQCRGCRHVINDELLALASVSKDFLNICETKQHPEAMWLNGKRCAWATHLVREEKKPEKHIDPIKASKAKMKGR